MGLLLRSRGLMRGYWRDPERTAQTLRPDGWLVSSDLGSLDEAGNLTIIGRADDAYIRGGYNVFPSEVEAVLLAHPLVSRVTVVATPAPVIGEIGVAFVVPTTAVTAVTAEELRMWCRERIADYKVPERIVFLDVLPKGVSGKIQRRALKDILAAPAQ